MDWEVTVVTQSNYIKKVIVNDCVTRKDAEEAAIGMTAAKKVIVSNPCTNSLSRSYEDSSKRSTSTYNDNVDDSNPLAGLLIVVIGMILISGWQYIVAFCLIGFAIWFFFFRDKYD